MEKEVAKRKLASFRDRPNPWKDKTPLERLAAVTEISQAAERNDHAKQGFPRVYRITREGKR